MPNQHTKATTDKRTPLEKRADEEAAASREKGYVAARNIKHNGKTLPAGEAVDVKAAGLSKDDVAVLEDCGALVKQ